MPKPGGGNESGRYEVATRWLRGCRAGCSLGPFGFADFVSGDRLGGSAGDLGEKAVVVVDAPGVVGGFNREGASSVRNADVDALSGNDYRAATADSTVDADRFGSRLGSRAGRASVTDAGHLC